MLNAMSSVPFLEGHIVDAVHEQEDGSLLIVLDTCPASDAVCGACRQPCALVHERRRRKVRDRDILDKRVWLDVPVRRLDYHNCNARVAGHIAWLDRGARVTHRVRLWVEALGSCFQLPI